MPLVSNTNEGQHYYTKITFIKVALQIRFEVFCPDFNHVILRDAG